MHKASGKPEVDVPTQELRGSLSRQRVLRSGGVRGFVVAKQSQVIPAKLSNAADVSGISSHNGLWHLACGHIDVVAGERADICLELKAMIPQGLEISSLDHFA